MLRRVLRPHALAIVALVLFAVLGMWRSRDFSANWDEPTNRKNGVAALEHAERFLRTGEPAPRVSQRSEHGTAFEMALALVERAFGYRYPEDRPSVYLMRHRATFLVFCLAIVALYLLARRYLNSAWLALLAAALLATHPRIFGHAFNNTSDIVFLAAFTAAHLSLFHLIRKPRARWAAAHGVLCAVAIDVRIVGLVLVGVSLVCLVAAGAGRAENVDRRGLRRQVMRAIGIYLVTTAATTVLLWPFLWGAPLDNFVWALKSMGRIEWGHFVRYAGADILASDVPWHYNLVWIGLTSPPLLLLAAGVAFGVELFAVLRAPVRFARERPFSLALGAWVALPLAAPVLLGSVLFDGWRHHFFVYPSLVIYALWAAQQLQVLGSTRFVRIPAWVRRAALPVVGLGIVALNTVDLAELHPFQALHFNVLGQQLAGAGTNHRFDMDYWGLTQREGLELIAKLEADSSRVIYLPVSVPILPKLAKAPGAKPTAFNTPLALSSEWLPPGVRQRIRFVESPAEGTYFLGTYRWWRGEYPPRFGEEIYEKVVRGVKVLTVRRLPPIPRGSVPRTHAAAETGPGPAPRSPASAPTGIAPAH